MPVRREPRSLEELCTRKACEDLDQACRRLQSLSSMGSSSQHILEYAKRILRPYYVNSLPGTIRSRMIDETSRILNERANDAGAQFSARTPLYLLAILLGPDIKRLRINLCCYYGCSHQADLLKLLSTEGVGIESLELARSALLRLDCGLLRSALRNMTKLQSLTMKNIASDSILEVIGRSCPKLAVLDVACSQQVTDVGIQRMLIELRVRVRKDAAAKLAERDGTSVKHDNDKTRRRGTTWSRIKSLLTKLGARSDKSDKKDDYLLDIGEARNSICESLKILNISKTGVTSSGVLFILSEIPNLESLAEYGYVGRALDPKNRDFREFKKTYYNLKQARDSCTTIKRLENLAELCPSLRKLWIFEPRHPASALAAFSSITSLSVDAAPPESQWINGFYDYLREHGTKLAELNLRIARSENTPDMDLRAIFLNCPNLVSLTKEGSHIVWHENNNNNNNDNEPAPLYRLRRIQIGAVVSAKTIVKILTLAPELASLHVHSCNELTDRHLEILRVASSSSSSSSSYDERDQTTNFRNGIVNNLTCFYIDEANGVSANSVINMFENCKNLRHIGNLVNWGLSCEEMRRIADIIATRNVDVELCPVAHWLWNTYCLH